MPDLRDGTRQDHSHFMERYAGNHENYGNSNLFRPPNNYCHPYGIEFRSRAHEEDDTSPSSPPLWRTSPSSISPAKPSSPTSRLQAIARGRRELMQMLQNMPESTYELSLRDLVEQRPVSAVPQSSTVEEVERRKHGAIEKRKETRRQDSQSGRVHNGGFLLKMFFPASWSKKKNKSVGGGGGGGGTCSKVSPLEKCVEVERWKKRFNVSGDGETSSKKSSSSNGSSRCSRHVLHLLPSCCSFAFNRRKTRAKRGFFS